MSLLDTLMRITGFVSSQEHEPKHDHPPLPPADTILRRFHPSPAGTILAGDGKSRVTLAKPAVKTDPQVACCHKCHLWFATYEARNHHKAVAHG